MDKPIVSPKQMPVHKVIGRVAEWYRMMAEAGLNFDDLQHAIDDPDFRSRLVEFWRSGGANKAVSGAKFKTWKTLKLGTGLTTADDFRKTLKKAGCKISDWANDILGKPDFSVAATKEIEVDLVVVSVAELGFPDGATRKQIYAKAQELGLELCPPEVGPQLRLQYKDQPNGEWLLIGMEPISVSDGNLDVFGVERLGVARWLLGFYDRTDDVWPGGYRWVFLRRK